jgi:hypothetical protein
MLYIGGPHFWCLECQVLVGQKIANLPKIEFNEDCSISGHFERGKDVITIIRLLISYLQNNYPMIKSIHFNDFSYRNCSETQTVDLAPFYYLLHGKTWYMVHMDAIFVEDDEALKFAEASERFQEQKSKMKWEDMDSYITAAHPLPLKDMKSLFESTYTWSSYFNTLSEKTDINTLCCYMAPWVTNFVAKVGKLRFHSPEFALPIPNSMLGKIEYRIENYNVRGGKYTRKQPKRKAIDLK